jgi:hypothetical protein
MAPEWNTRSMVEVPELLVSGLLHESDWPTLLGAFSRATLSKIIWLSQGARPWPKFPANGMTWACAAAGRRAHTASAADKQCGDRGHMHISFTSSAPTRSANTPMRQVPPQPPARWSWFSSNHNYFLYHLLTGRTASGCSRVSRISSVSCRITRHSPSRSAYSTFS